MGKKYIVKLDRESCIGAAACVAVQPDQWQIVDDGKVDFLNSKTDEKSKGWFVKEIDESELLKFKESAEVCPVNVIHIFEKDTGKKVV
ncbi:ferredoxin [Candidatus Woesearchaeota archaeon]|nr:ferredoxin [Candidatus Woesearchaeota archaeon]